MEEYQVFIAKYPVDKHDTFIPSADNMGSTPILELGTYKDDDKGKNIRSCNLHLNPLMFINLLLLV